MSDLRSIFSEYKSGKMDKHQYIANMHKKHLTLFEYADYLKETDIESIHVDENDIYVVLRESGIKLYVDRYDSRFIPIEILNFHSFDPIEKDLIYKLAEKSKTIFDVGGNIGWYTLNFSLLSGVDKVHTFEPIPRTFDFLKRHVAFNNIDNVIINNFALSDRQGISEFYWSEKETGSSSMRNIQDRESVNKVECKLETLDQYVKENNCVVDMIKCDVEGSELFVFEGGRKTIQRDKPFVFTEMLRKWSAKFDYHPNDIIYLFSELGYLCFAYVGTELKKFDQIEEDTIPTNYFFLHNDKHKEVINNLGLR
jgi:FkbM family methyltransferase